MFKTSNRGIGKKKKKGFNPPKKLTKLTWTGESMLVPLVYGLGVTVCNKGINSREMFYVLVRVMSNIINGIRGGSRISS